MSNCLCVSVSCITTWHLYFQPGLDLGDYLARKGHELQTKNCGCFGPHVLVLSDADDRDVAVYSVIQGNLFFEMNSIIEAIDACIKASFVFGLSYPLSARCSWTFVQQMVFGVNTDDDIQSTKLIERVAYVKSYK